MNLDQRRRYTRWHSRGVPTRWLVTDEAHTYRTARDTDPAPGERLVVATENDLQVTRGLTPDPPRSVLPPWHPPRSA